MGSIKQAAARWPPGSPETEQNRIDSSGSGYVARHLAVRPRTLPSSPCQDLDWRGPFDSYTFQTTTDTCYAPDPAWPGTNAPIPTQIRASSLRLILWHLRSLSRRHGRSHGERRFSRPSPSWGRAERSWWSGPRGGRTGGSQGEVWAVASADAEAVADGTGPMESGFG